MATVPAPDDDVEKLLTGIMAKQSPLMKQARTQGLQGAQNAGLGQSTMGIKAAQAAAYNAALPIASQQAQQAHQKNTQTAQFGHETGMQTAGFQHAATQAEKDRAQQTAIENLSAYNQRLAMGDQSRYQQQTIEAQAYWDRINTDWNTAAQQRIMAMEISARNKEVALNAVTQMNAAHASAYAQVAQNHELPADVRGSVLQYLDNIRSHNQNISSATFRYDIPW